MIITSINNLTQINILVACIWNQYSLSWTESIGLSNINQFDDAYAALGEFSRNFKKGGGCISVNIINNKNKTGFQCFLPFSVQCREFQSLFIEKIRKSL